MRQPISRAHEATLVPAIIIERNVRIGEDDVDSVKKSIACGDIVDEALW